MLGFSCYLLFSVLLHIPLNVELVCLLLLSLFGVRLSCKNDGIPCNDGDNSPYKQCAVVVNIAVRQIPSVFMSA